MQIKEINKLKNEIEQILNENKALEVKSIDLKGKTSVADFMIVASGNSSRHIQALSETLIDQLKKKCFSSLLNNGRFILESSKRDDVPPGGVSKHYGDTIVTIWTKRA